MSRPSNRQELYDRIRRSSKDEVILEEMVRLGFWPAEGKLPSDPADEIRRRGELQRELVALQTEATRLDDAKAMKREAHRRRLAEARQRREETKARHEQQRRDRAQAWARRRSGEIVYLGEDVSRSLSDVTSDEAALQKHELPILNDAASIASAMGISVPELRFLAFDRRVASQHHYQRFFIPKKTGGDRLISAPMPRLKQAQQWVLDAILSRVPVHPAAHGFVPNRSIVTNAQPHVGRAAVINLDLADFFPSITWVRVRGMFRRLGYSRQAATILALLCTEREVDEVVLDGVTWFVARTDRLLPQGSPASPAITNVLCRRLDARLQGLARKHDLAYTRYADDLTFSHARKDAPVGTVLAACRKIVENEGFRVHPDKTRVMRRGRRQEVTGIVVNDKPGLERATLRRFRALLFQIERDGPEGKTWGHGVDLFASILGFASYVFMVDAAKGTTLLARARALAEKHGHRMVRRHYPKREPTRAHAAMPLAPEPAPLEAEGSIEEPSRPKKKWWQFWK
jgi:RNA-directed DNA polymerase